MVTECHRIVKSLSCCSPGKSSYLEITSAARAPMYVMLSRLTRSRRAESAERWSWAALLIPILYLQAETAAALCPVAADLPKTTEESIQNCCYPCEHTSWPLARFLYGSSGERNTTHDGSSDTQDRQSEIRLGASLVVPLTDDLRRHALTA